MEPISAKKSASYGERHDYKPGETIPVVLNGVEAGSLAVQDLLP